MDNLYDRDAVASAFDDAFSETDATIEPDPMAGARALDRTEHWIRRFCALPGEPELVATTLWAAGCHMIGYFDTYPRLAFLSPEPASGKTRCLEALELIVPEPMLSISASPAAIFRSLEKGPLTLLFDETDTIFTRRGKDDDNGDLRALLNSGYRVGATIPRCVGPTHDVRHFPVFAPVALAGLGDLPEALLSRSVIIHMRPRAPGERIEQFRRRLVEPAALGVREALEAWTAEAAPRMVWPQMPAGVVDRQAELWEALLAIADLAGGDWPERARAACLTMVAAAAPRAPSLGVRLLNDCKDVFGQAEALPTAAVLARLAGQEPLPDGDRIADDAPWGDLRGKPLDARGLARMLRKYGISPCTIRTAGGTPKGYRRSDFYDAWARYLTLTPQEAQHPQHPQHSQFSAGSSVADSPEFVADVAASVPDPEISATEKINENNVVSDVADVAAAAGSGTLRSRL